VTIFIPEFVLSILALIACLTVMCGAMMLLVALGHGIYTQYDSVNRRNEWWGPWKWMYLLGRGDGKR
jgi:hypothetical protein